MNKFDRVVSTLVLLQTKKVITAETISSRFDVSLRTVYRDIKTLKTAGIPIIGDPGFGYSVVDGYKLPPLMFNEGEAAALLTAGKFIGRMTDQDTQAYYASAMAKIKAILRSSEKQALSVLDDSITFSDQSKWKNKPYIQDLFKSIASKNILEISYQKADGSSSNRNLEAIGCYHKFNNWYLVAFCQSQEDYRTFKMNRITSLRVLEEHFDREHITLKAYLDQQVSARKEQEHFYTIEIAFNHSLVKFAENRKFYFGFIDQVEVGEAVHMKFLNTSIEIFARWLLQFGDQATVLAPDELIDRVKTLSAKLYKHYQ